MHRRQPLPTRHTSFVEGVDVQEVTGVDLFPLTLLFAEEGNPRKSETAYTHVSRTVDHKSTKALSPRVLSGSHRSRRKFSG